MTSGRLEHTGNAIETYLASTITSGSTSITLNASTGWSSGSVGKFVMQIDDGTNVETILIESRTGDVLTVATSGRGWDGTTAAGFTAGAATICRHVFSAAEADELNVFLNDPGTSGDITDIGTATAAGSTGQWADAGHTHQLGVGSIDAANLFAAGVVDAAAIATDAVGTPEIVALAVGTAELAADAVTGAKIADDAVDSEHIVDGSIDLAHMSVNSIDSDQYVDGSIDTAHYAAGSVDTTALGSDAVTSAKIADDQIDSEHIVDGSIDPAHLASKVITDAKLGIISACTVSRTATQSITEGASGAAVQFNATDISDISAMHDPVTNNTRVTVPTTGLYNLKARIRWAGASSPDASGTIGILLKLNGSTTIIDDTYSTTSLSDSLLANHLDIVYPLTTADYVEVFAIFDDSNDSPSSLNITDAKLTVVYVGASS